MKVLLYKEQDIIIYTIQAFPKDPLKPSLNQLEKIEIRKGTIIEKSLQFNLDVSVEDPQKESIEAIHSLYQQLIQTKITQGYIAINLAKRKTD